MTPTPCLAYGPDGARCARLVHPPTDAHTGHYLADDGALTVIEWMDGLRLDLGSGPHPAGTTPNPNGPDAPHLGVDLAAHLGDEAAALLADQVVVDVDLFATPWPWHDDSVDAIWCSHFIEHLPPNTYDRATGRAWYPVLDFLGEVARVLKPGATATFTWPNMKSERAWQDPTHNHAIAVPTFLYASRQWRQENDLDRAPYPVHADLEIVGLDMGEVHPRFRERHPDVIAAAAEHYWEAFQDCRVTVAKRPG